MIFGRRIAFALLVLSSQLLLIALAVVFSIQMIMIAVRGEVTVIEGNLLILYFEIAASLIVVLFAGFVFALQLKRLFEKRKEDNRQPR